MFKLKIQFLIGFLFISGCASSGGFLSDNVSNDFRKALANVDSFCKQNKLGPYLDGSDRESMRSASATDCEVLKIKPYDLNAVLATTDGKFAYSIQLPSPLDKPRVRRSDYGSAGEYFQALCEKEEGETIWRTVRHSGGLAMLRIPPSINNHYRLGSFSEETMVSKGGGSQPELLLIQRMGFDFVERPTRSDELGLSKVSTLRKYTLIPNKPIAFPDYALRFEVIESFSAPYGVLWRGTPQLDSREEGIIGGELIVIDRASRDVLAVRRLFTKDEVDLSIKDSVRYISRSCPGKVTTEGYDFIGRVLTDATTEPKR